MTTALVAKGNKVPAHLSGGGTRGNEEVSADHLTIPRVKLLQKMSDEVDKHHDNYVEGAEVGDFMNTLDGTLFKGEMLVINLKFKDEHVVWRQRDAGGGLLGSFGSVTLAEAAISEQEKPDEYDISQTHTHMLLVLDEKTGEVASNPVLMDFASSKLRVSKNWNSQILDKGNYDRFAGVWKLKSKQVANRAGATYMNLEASFHGWASEDIYKVAEEAFERFCQSGS